MATIKKLKRISTKELLGFKRGDDGATEIKKLLANGVEKIYRITGNVTGYTEKKTQYGESFALNGDFLAQNLLTGELFEASKAFLTKSYSEDLVAAFKNRSVENSGIGFTAEVSIMEDSASGTGYSYDVSNVATAENMAWKQEALQSLLSLPAPVVKKLKAAK